MDYLSLVLSTIGFGLVLYGFSSVGNDGWGSRTVILSLLIGFIFVAIFIWRQLHLTTPFLDFRVFKSFEFSIASIIGSVSFMAMIGFEMVLPLYLQIVRGMSAFHSGLTLLGGALMMGLMSPVTGKLFDRYGAKRLAICGLFLLSLGTFPFMFLTEDTAIAYIVVLYAMRMFGIAMVMMPVTTAAMNSLHVDMMAHGTAVNNTLRQICGSVATAIMVSILSNVTSNNLPSHLLRINDPLRFRDLAIAATLKGYTAAFAVSFVISLAAFVLVFFLKSDRQKVTVKGEDEE